MEDRRVSMIPGKLYRVSNYAHKHQVFVSNLGPTLLLLPHVMRCNGGIRYDELGWIEVYKFAVVMWIGRQDTPIGTMNTVLYEDHGVCAVSSRWENEDLAKKLVLAKSFTTTARTA